MRPDFLLMFLTISLLTVIQSFAASPLKIRSVNLGGWLVIEGWMKMSLFDAILENRDLLDGTQIALKSVNLGTYVCAEDGGGQKMVVDRQMASGWETFKLWRVSSTKFQLRVFNNNFVSVANQSGVDSTKDTPGEWETFEILRNPNNPKLVHIKAYSGMYLQAKDENQLTADYNGEPGWDNNAAVFEMSNRAPLHGEFQLANAFGTSSAAQVVFANHRNNFVTAKDFEFLAANGINTVRIPVGWWIAYDPSPPKPFVGGSLQALDNAFTWAGSNNINVIIDLHAAPGSQNPWEHSANRDGVSTWSKKENIDTTLEVIDFLASRYSRHPALLGIELLNEARKEDVSLDVLETYYKQGYERVRKYSSTAYVIMGQRIGADPIELVNTLNGSTNVVLDVHYYNAYTPTFDDKSVQWHVDYINNERRTSIANLEKAGNALIFVGEWSNQINVIGASNEDFARYATAQLTVYKEASFGWSFWSIRNEDQSNLHWDFERSVQTGQLQRGAIN
ncbi:probable glucan 1,3-beta-glucosidase A isoform X1 [Selaginella moellendorffii]|uniref:probable glucan 1,3-beta-glucosidase A isoform X1 n=1 Tax=Selaginella moellendorffii TaxID=88036 RepID=UPI000D1C21B4|nr:probable glucan 1,3-beta-glucosidase A isoform X1 [Selaginella moellendorffii]|eukprot:XP_024517468.1 probable glucan 1,3-beta-glucosidase A isoform X1 [Selaginella moellendorffii]